MIKKSALAVLAVSVGLSANLQAESTVVTNKPSMSVEQRLDKMQKRIDQLEAEAKARQTPVVAHSSAHVSKDANVAKMQGQIAKLEENDHKWHHYFNDPDISKNSDGEYSTFRNRGSLISLVHEDTEYGPSTTFEEFPSSIVPLSMLQIKNKFGSEENGHKALVFGGYLEADTQGWWGSDFTQPAPGGFDSGRSNATGNYNSGEGVFLTTANLDVMANINQWTQTYMVINATQNSIKLQQAFVTFGNLDKFPMFVTVGKNRMPLGTFAGGGPWVSGISQALFRPARITNVTVGYYKDGLNTNLSVFSTKAEKGAQTGQATGTPSTMPTEPANGNYSGNFLYSVFYNGVISDTKVAYGVNAGYLYNMANTGIGASQQIADTGDLLNRQDRNSVLNFEGHLAYQEYSVFGGLATTTMERKYTFGNRAGAWYIQGNYAPDVNIFGSDRKTTFSLAYNGAYNTQNMPMAVAGDASTGPSITGVQKEVVTFVRREVLTQVFLGLEYSWMGMYDGQHSNNITLDTSIYF